MPYAPQFRSSGMWDIQFDGFTALQNELSRFTSRAPIQRTQIEKAFKDYGKRVRDVFDTHGAIVSTSWAPLSDWRGEERGGSYTPILEWESALKRAASQYKSGSTSERRGTVVGQKVVTDDTGWVAISGAKVYLAEEWTNNLTGNKVPGRPFWPWGNEEIDLLVRPFEDWLDQWFK